MYAEKAHLSAAKKAGREWDFPFSAADARKKPCRKKATQKNNLITICRGAWITPPADFPCQAPIRETRKKRNKYFAVNIVFTMQISAPTRGNSQNIYKIKLLAKIR